MSAKSGTFGDRVADTASSISGSTVTLSNAAPTGYQTFGSYYSNGDYVPAFLITDGTNWEVSFGQYTSSGTTLGRAATPHASSNGGAQVVSFTGTINVLVVEAAAYVNVPVNGIPSKDSAGVQNYMYMGILGTIGGSARALGREIYIPVWMDAPFNSVSVKFNLGTKGIGAVVMDVGLYSNLGGQVGGKAPGTLLMSQTGLPVGTTNGSTTGDNTASSMTKQGTPRPFFPGLYWIGLLPRSGTSGPTLRSLSSSSNALCATEIFGQTTVPNSASVAATATCYLSSSATLTGLETTAAISTTAGTQAPQIVVIPS